MISHQILADAPASPNDSDREGPRQETYIQSAKRLTRKPPNWPLFLFTVCLLAFIATLSYWLVTASIHTTIKTRAVAVPSGKSIVIKSDFNGSIHSTFKRAGATVKIGEELLIVRDRESNEGLEASLAKQAALRAKLSRLDAEVNQTPPIFSERLKKFFAQTVKQELAIFENNKKQLALAVGVLKTQQNELEKELKEKRPKLIERQYTREEILLLEQKISEISIEINELNNAFITSAAAQQKDTLAELKLLDHALEAREYRAKNNTIVAPINGTIIKIANPQKGTISIGSSLVEIMPNSESFFIKTITSSHLVNFYQKGSTVQFSPLNVSGENQSAHLTSGINTNLQSKHFHAVINSAEYFSLESMTPKLKKKLGSTQLNNADNSALINPTGLLLELIAQPTSDINPNSADKPKNLKPTLGTELLLETAGGMQSPLNWFFNYYQNNNKLGL